MPDDTEDKNGPMLAILRKLQEDVAAMKTAIVTKADRAQVSNDNDMRQAMSALKDEVRTTIAETRRDLTNDIEAFRRELRADFAETRVLMRSQGELHRAEIRMIGRTCDRTERQLDELMVSLQGTKEAMEKVSAAVAQLTRNVRALEERS